MELLRDCEHKRYKIRSSLNVVFKIKKIDRLKKDDKD
jgi:hypothetical protein